MSGVSDFESVKAKLVPALVVDGELVKAPVSSTSMGLSYGRI
jgi:hypothetical protein